MNVGQLVQKIKDMVAAAKAGSYLAAGIIALEIIRAIFDSIPTTELGKVRGGMRAVDESKSIDDLCNEIDGCCTSAPVGSGTMVMTAPTARPFIDAMLPIIFALLKKFIGL